MNDLNLLMARVDEINAKAAADLTADDIDTIILYHRQSRARKASGEKPAKPKVDLSAILNLKPKSAAPAITRRL